MSKTSGSLTGNVPLADWDRDIDAKGLFRLSPHDKRARTIASLRRKVDEVAAAASTRPGTGLQGLPGTLAALRQRNDPTLGMYVLRDRAAEQRPDVAVEIERWKAAVLILTGPRVGTAATLAEKLVEVEAKLASSESREDVLRQQLARAIKELATRSPSRDQLRR